jgi:hypothetical protein
LFLKNSNNRPHHHDSQKLKACAEAGFLSVFELPINISLSLWSKVEQIQLPRPLQIGGDKATIENRSNTYTILIICSHFMLLTKLYRRVVPCGANFAEA